MSGSGACTAPSKDSHVTDQSHEYNDTTSPPLDRLAFSYESLRHAARWILEVGGATGEWNAHFDSFLVHSRKLLDFFTLGERTHPDDMLVEDVVGEGLDLSFDAAADARPMINKRVLHLTSSANPQEVRWQVETILAEFQSAFERLESRLEDGHPFHERLNQAIRGEDLAFRKYLGR